MKYRLDMSEKQALILVRALDHYVRTGIGQFEHVGEVYDLRDLIGIQTRDVLRDALDVAKGIVGHPRNGSYGIHNAAVDNEFRIAHDIQQVVRHGVAWSRKPEGGIQVDFTDPHPTSGEPLPKMSVEE